MSWLTEALREPVVALAQLGVAAVAAAIAQRARAAAQRAQADVQRVERERPVRKRSASSSNNPGRRPRSAPEKSLPPKLSLPGEPSFNDN